MPAGRPTKYRKEYCDEILDYFGRPPYVEVTRTNPKTGMEYTERQATDLPTVERFASELGVAVSTVYQWTHEHPEFSEAFTRARQMQVDHLLQNGLHGHFREGLAKFMLTNLSEYQERKFIDQTVREELPELTDEELAEIAREAGEMH